MHPDYFNFQPTLEGAATKSMFLFKAVKFAIFWGKHDSNHIKHIIGANQGDDGV